MKTVRNSIIQFLKKMWPQAPFGLVLIFIGCSNIFTKGLQLHGNSTLYQLVAQITPISELSREVSLGILGSGVQVLLGIVMVATGIGLFWRLRSAWAFSIILLIITIAVEFTNRISITNQLLPVLALAALIIWQSRFNRLSIVGSYLMSVIGILAVFAYGIFGSYLLGNEFKPAIHDLSTSLYFTVVTLSTVGSNIYPASPEGQLFMVSLILGGISIFTTTIVSTARPLISKQFRVNSRGKKSGGISDEGVILVGSSTFAKSIAEELNRRKIQFSRVSAHESRKDLGQQDNSDYSPDEEKSLIEAGILSANIIVIAHESDEENASTAAAARKLNPNIRIAIAVRSSEAVVKQKFKQTDLIFSPESAAAMMMADWIGGKPIQKELDNLASKERQ